MPKINEKYNIMLREMFNSGSGRTEQFLERENLLNRMMFSVPVTVIEVQEPVSFEQDHLTDITYTPIKVGIYPEGSGLVEEYVIPHSGRALNQILTGIERAYESWIVMKRGILGDRFNPKRDDPFYKK